MQLLQGRRLRQCRSLPGELLLQWNAPGNAAQGIACSWIQAGPQAVLQHDEAGGLWVALPV
eukprot:1159763-Pelagomonas_calceolata.AAC.11